MIIFENVNIKELILQIITQSQAKFTGRMNIKTSNDVNYGIYFGLGRVVWASGGSHSHHRWQRMLLRHCDQPEVQPTIRGEDKFEAWDYHLLSILVKRKQIPLGHLPFIITNILEEILFDLYQDSVRQDEFHIRWDQGRRPSQQQVLPPQTVISPETIANKVAENWGIWQQENISSILPDLAPTIESPKELQQLIPPQVYQNLYKVIDGQRSLRDIALIMKLQLTKLVKVLSPYIRRGMITLVVVPDIPVLPTAEIIPVSVLPTDAKISSPQGFLIVCIDDNKKVCEDMEHHLISCGYRFLGLQDSVMALATLLEVKPDLIFLDLIMPVANGYEICAQIRRISLFQDTPVVILTGNDGLVDRVRAKMVGATDFLTKPAKPEKLLATIQRYLKVSPPENH